MFERFTTEAREIVVRSQQDARDLGHQHIGTEHLLLGLAEPKTLAGTLLAERGLDHAAVRQAVLAAIDPAGLDEQALDSIGIDLGAVRERAEATFGAGALDRAPSSRSGRSKRPTISHLPFTKRAKKALELSLREAVRLDHGYIGDGHLLLGILREGGGLGYRTIVGAGIDVDALRTEVAERIPPG